MTSSLYDDIDLAALSEILAAEGFAFDAPAPIPRVQADAVEASFAQARLWYLAQLRPDDWSYHLAAAFRAAPTVMPDRVEAAFARVLARHDTLNSLIRAPDGRPLLSPMPTTAIQLHRIAIPAGADDPAVSLTAALRDALQRPFDLAAERPLRLSWLMPAEGAPVLLIVIHHVAADGWSMPILARDFLSAYDQGGTAPLPALPVAYRDFAAWQRQQVEAGALEASLAYWADRLRGCPTQLAFPFDHGGSGHPAGPLASRTGFTLPFDQVDALATSLRVSPYAVLITLYAVLLARHADADDLLIATTTAGRDRPDLEEIIGLFVNTIPHRFTLDWSEDVRAMLQRSAAQLLSDLDHQDAPFDLVVAGRIGDRRADGDPLCRIAFVLQNYPDAGIAYGHAGFVPEPVPLAATRYDLSLVAEPGDGVYHMTLYHRAGWMSDGFAQAFTSRFAPLLARLAAGDATPLGRLDILSPEDHQRRRAISLDAGHATTRSPTDTPSPAPWPIDRIRAMAAIHPQACAVSGPDGSVSYQALLGRVEGIAATLAAHGVTGGDVVAVLLPRSADAIAVVLGIMSAGAAFLLLDPRLPANRLRYLEADSRAVFTITDHATMRASGFAPKAPLLSHEILADGPPVDQPHQCPAPQGDAPAYVIYTSGSTGQPKGAVVPVRGIANFLSGLQAIHPIGAGDRMAHKAAPGFDVAIWEMLWPLCHGARVVVVPQGMEADPTALADLFEAAGVTIAHFVPAMLRFFVDAIAPGRCPELRLVFAGGEALPPSLIRAVYGCLPATLINSYGPSETSIGVTHWLCDPAFSGPLTPIGRAMPGVGLHILDARLNDVPAGVPGQLFISGPSVGLGYIGRPDLTARAFLNPDTIGADVADGHYHGPLYATGDLVRLDPAGQLLFLGRIDDQVKLRGQRIEPGEVEATLLRQSGVRHAMVVIRHDDAGDAQLVAAVVAEADASLDPSTLQAALALDLPAAMIPARIVVLDALPVTANGKRDHRAVQDAIQAPLMADMATEAPLTGQEAMVASLFEAVLGAAPTHRDADFFQMGGHSLLAVQVLTQLHRRTGLRIPLATFVARPTVGAVADLLTAGTGGAIQLLRPASHGYPTVILLHPALGISRCYLPLGQALPATWGVILVDDDTAGNATTATNATTIEDRARHYAAALRPRWPQGPTILGGWSLGGLLAMALVPELARHGLQPDQLLLIDSHIRDRTDNDGDAAPDRASWPGFLRALGVALPQTGPATTTTLVDRIMAAADEDDALAIAADHLGGTVPNLRELAAIYRRNALAARRFQPAATTIPTVCVVATRTTDAQAMRSLWGAVLSQPEVIDLDADHESVVQAPAIHRIASALQTAAAPWMKAR